MWILSDYEPQAHRESLPAPAVLQPRLQEKRCGHAESKAQGSPTKRSNCFAYSPLFSFSFELSQSSHLMLWLPSTDKNKEMKKKHTYGKEIKQRAS